MPLVMFFEFWHFIRPLVLSSRSQDGPTVSIRGFGAHHAASPPLLSSQRHIAVTYSVRADVLVLELAPGAMAVSIHSATATCMHENIGYVHSAVRSNDRALSFLLL
jgi:hypothetical protein